MWEKITATVVGAIAVFCLNCYAGGGPIDVIPETPEMKVSVPAGTPNPCSGLEFSYRERIAQGKLLGFIPDFLRIASPSQHNRNVERAIYYNTYIAWEAHKLRSDPNYSFDNYLIHVPYNMRPAHTSLQLMGYRFEMSQLCEIAKKKGVRRLTFACESDMVEEAPVEIPRDPESRSGRREERRGAEFVATKCFVSTHPDKDPSWSDLVKRKWGNDIDAVEYADDASTYLDSDGLKQALYMPLIRRVVSGVVVDENEKHRKASANAKQPDVSHCFNSGSPAPEISGMVIQK